MSQQSSIGLDYSHNNKLTLEASSFAEFTQFLFSSGYKLGKIQAGFDSLKKLENYNMIILSSPKNSKLSEEEIEVLDNYVKQGGNLLVISSSGGDYTNRSNLNDLTKKFGFEFENDEVNDSMNYVNLQKRPLLTKFKAHLVTEQIKKLVFSSASSLKVLDFIEDDENIKIETLITGGLNCWHKLYDGKNWVDENSPKIPLLVAVDYYKGRVVGFGNLSIFSSLGREYGFAAFDNDVLIANILRYLATGIVSEGKVVTVNLNLELFYWANSIIRDQNWESVSDVINLSLKYFKDHYKEIIEDIKKSREDRLKRKKEYEAKKDEVSEEDKILEMVPVRKREDLDDIMSELENITGEKVELQLDLDKDDEIDVDPEIKKEVKDFEKEIEEELEKELEEEIEKEEKLIMEQVREEIEKEIDQEFESEESEKIQDELEKKMGESIEKEKQVIRDKVKEEIKKEEKKILVKVKDQIDEQEDEDTEKILEEARIELEGKRKEILKQAKKDMEKARERRIEEIKKREVEIIKENEDFFEDILEATDLFSAPILDSDKDDNEEDT